jgi:hypothetical protein
MDLMRERTSDAYRVQAEMMIGQAKPQFNQVPTSYKTAQQHYNIVQQQYNTVQPQYNTAQPHYNPSQYKQAPQYNAPQGYRVGYRCGGRARGGFGRGRGPVVCHNCQQPRHYEREFRLPPATCMYCQALDHDTKECPTLLGKI